MQKITISVILGLILASTFAVADNYRVTTLRASPGQLETLIGEVKAYRQQMQGRVIIMRHSQGDQWDLLLLEPAGSEPARAEDFGALVDFQQGLLAASDSSFGQLQASADKTSLYHIEMFHALAGKKEALVDQRVRENRYLQVTGQTTNAVFVTSFGSDVDVFTVGFHKDMHAFSEGPSVSDAAAEKAARDAGFKNRADLGFYLRSLLISHHDTLAVPVRN
jgi:hypothetical protein